MAVYIYIRIQKKRDEGQFLNKNVHSIIQTYPCKQSQSVPYIRLACRDCEISISFISMSCIGGQLGVETLELRA